MRPLGYEPVPCAVPGRVRAATVRGATGSDGGCVNLPRRPTSKNLDRLTDVRAGHHGPSCVSAREGPSWNCHRRIRRQSSIPRTPRLLAPAHHEASGRTTSSRRSAQATVAALLLRRLAGRREQFLNLPDPTCRQTRPLSFREESSRPLSSGPSRSSASRGTATGTCIRAWSSTSNSRPAHWPSDPMAQPIPDWLFRPPRRQRRGGRCWRRRPGRLYLDGPQFPPGFHHVVHRPQPGIRYDSIEPLSTIQP